MTRETTSLPAHVRVEWASYLAFLKRPALPDRALPPGKAGLLAWLRMLGLDLAIMLVLVSCAIIALLAGVDLPETALAGVDITMQLAIMVVLVAPVAEEIIFRGWLSGRPGHVLALLLLGAGGAFAATLGISLTGRNAALSVGSGMLAAAVLALLALFFLRGRGAMGWFRAIFPVLFWFSTLAFASIHLLNYEQGSLAILLPLILPQFALGTILGYMRVNYGLWSCILLHATHNGLILGIVWLATLFES